MQWRRPELSFRFRYPVYTPMYTSPPLPLNPSNHAGLRDAGNSASGSRSIDPWCNALQRQTLIIVYTMIHNSGVGLHHVLTIVRRA
jgi:hypothetical protein